MLSMIVQKMKEIMVLIVDNQLMDPEKAKEDQDLTEQPLVNFITKKSTSPPNKALTVSLSQIN